MRQAFVVPDLDGPATGGTLYNARLIRALTSLGCDVMVSAGATPLLDALGEVDCVWVDSLYLNQVPILRRRVPDAAALGLLVHYLPTLLEQRAPLSPADLSEAERQALACAGRLLTPSPFMAELLAGLVPNHVPIDVVEPGCEVQLAPWPPRASGRVSVLMVCNLLPNKRVAEFLEALSRSVVPANLALCIAGSADLDAAYAARCLKLVHDHPALRAQVMFAGPVDPAQLQTWYANQDLLLSASLFESYGMALAEARAAGLPILACTGGNVANLVDENAGGELSASPEQLACSLLALCASPEELARRRHLARIRAPVPRSWQLAATEFAEALGCARR
ncbi:MAG TPA: glycosyltransferase family 4 protein [Polyangiaceae bacterium]|nr:glycosyltransferase family 4 protein [Polyangiaceae bacterium]